MSRVSFSVDLRVKALESQISELLKEKADFESKIEKLGEALIVREKQIEEFEKREEENFNLLLDDEREAVGLWFKKLKPVIDPIMDQQPALYLDYKRFNDILGDLTNEGGC